MGALALDHEAARRQQPRLFAVPGGAVTEPAPTRSPDGRGAVDTAAPAAAPRPATGSAAHAAPARSATGSGAHAAPARPATGSAVPAAPARPAKPGREEPLMPLVLGGPSVRVAVPRTLDAVVGDLFATAAAGRQATCLFCGGAVRPRPTAAGAAGAGRCGDCGTSYE